MLLLPKPEIKEIWASMPGFSPYIVWQEGVFINQKIIIDSKTEFNSVNIKVVHSCNSGLNVSSIQDSYIREISDNNLIKRSSTGGDFFNLDKLFSKTPGSNSFLEIGCSGEPGSNVKVPIEIK
ncbi:MAG: hypothetical protein QXF25_00375 [Candidatus Pacearchaeota archaeon]